MRLFAHIAAWLLAVVPAAVLAQAVEPVAFFDVHISTGEVRE